MAQPEEPSLLPPQLRPPKPLGLMAWIVGYKLVKAGLAISAAVLVFRLGGSDPVAVAHHWLHRLHLDPEGYVGTRLLHHAAHFDISRLYWVSGVFAAYTALYCVEAVGLYFEKRWAEWLTVVQTAILVPIEIYQVIRRHGAVESVALLISAATIVYLLWRMRHDDEEDKKEKNIRARPT